MSPTPLQLGIQVRLNASKRKTVFTPTRGASGTGRSFIEKDGSCAPGRTYIDLTTPNAG